MNIFQVKKVNLYIGKIFLKNFLKITAAIALVTFFIDIFDAYRQIRGNDDSLLKALEISLLQIPDFINNIAIILILMAAIITISSLSLRSEITIIRSSGFSLWQIIRPIVVISFLLGVVWITIFTSLLTHSAAKFNILEQKYINHEDQESIMSVAGIWLKQDDINHPGNKIIITAKKLYKRDLEFKNITLWFVNEKQEFYQRIDADEAFLKADSWLIKSALLNDDTHINQKVTDLVIPTNLVHNLVINKIINNFENEKLFSLYQLPGLIKDLRLAGFTTAKFEVYYHNLLSKPLLFMAMSLIACYFGLTPVRSKNAILMAFLGAAFGLLIYVTLSIISSLSVSGLIPIFAATWLVAIFLTAVGVLIIYEKEVV